ncbi:VOC family protein [Streptomyces gilvosporeus]|uniref:Glyoxalase/bleomycin resistance/extradiol dioxygenase family protein n=1 Tax=Streptomyces gilvosporeus TaxID=553510 RepID=A0A1V0TYI4_9ACTN|nr:VOC family protein [Streptomyces gilvosporeus]ARF57850.1 glyoxalase/bleomycin resistance/extradiol dioxygenase family protein [Streptomyces gilvosporeus]
MTTEAATRRMPGAPCWVSLLAHSLSATQEFYGALFGWEFRPGPQHFGPYARAYLDGQEVAGVGELAPDRHLPVAWTTYLASEDADATADQIRSCGGTVAVGPLDADDAGRMAIGSDPQGAIFGIWQGRSMRGTALSGEPGTPVWNELVTQETGVVEPFYERVFGFESEPVGAADFDYLTLHIKGHPVAGIHGVGTAPLRDRGPYWMTYFAVPDTDAAARRVTELGGRVLRPAQDSPHGRLAAVADCEGAAFTIIQTP